MYTFYVNVDFEEYVAWCNAVHENIIPGICHWSTHSELTYTPLSLRAVDRVALSIEPCQGHTSTGQEKGAIRVPVGDILCSIWWHMNQRSEGTVGDGDLILPCLLRCMEPTTPRLKAIINPMRYYQISIHQTSPCTISSNHFKKKNFKNLVLLLLELEVREDE